MSVATFAEWIGRWSITTSCNFGSDIFAFVLAVKIEFV